MPKQIECRVVKVDEQATRCQQVGNAFRVDAAIEGKLCARAREMVQAAAAEMQADGEGVESERDVFCPDNHVLYRLTVVDDDAVGDETCSLAVDAAAKQQRKDIA